MSSSFGAIRVFRALLAPSKSTATAASSSAAKPAKAAAKPKRASSSDSTTATKPRPRGSGIQKVTPVSPALAHFLNSPSASRAGAVKEIWSYIKTHNLQNPTNKREIFCDEKLKSIFDGKDRVGFLEIGKLLSRHFVKTD